jgi:microcystin-dependent protein
MWSGTTIPTGWALCDGTNGTPDLRGRFIVGYNPTDPDYAYPGNRSTGGFAPGNTGGEKQHTLTLNEIPSHRHNISQTSAAGAYVLYDGNAASGGEGNHARTTATPYPMNFNTDFQGGGQPHENRPPYYTLAYIMKL